MMFNRSKVCCAALGLFALSLSALSATAGTFTLAVYPLSGYATLSTSWTHQVTLDPTTTFNAYYVYAVDEGSTLWVANDDSYNGSGSNLYQWTYDPVLVPGGQWLTEADDYVTPAGGSELHYHVDSSTINVFTGSGG
jgi:hypothetical protein